MIVQDARMSTGRSSSITVNYFQHEKASESCRTHSQPYNDYIPSTNKESQSCGNRKIVDACGDIVTVVSAGSIPIQRPRILKASTEMDPWHRIFRSIGCRGFSFSFKPCRLPYQHLRLDLECFALVVDDWLYYPPRIRTTIQELAKTDAHLPGAIGWVLVKPISWSNTVYWVVLNIQSDWASRGPTWIRDHFRGWQRILIYCLLLMAEGSGIAAVAMPRASAVARASYPLRANANPPQHWVALYDGTAEVFEMKMSRFLVEVDIQTIAHLPPVMCSCFYVREFD